MRYWEHRERLTPVVVLMLWLMATQTSAVWAVGAGCRTDPKFFFGNGDKLTIVATLNVAKSDIASIQYVVHAPAHQKDDQSEVKIVYTGLPPGVEQAEVRFDLETFLLSHGIPPTYAYYVEANAQTHSRSGMVTFDMGLNQQDPATVSGSTGTWLMLGVTQ
jgi:hypothetical protein